MKAPTSQATGAPAELCRAIQEEALRLGFLASGITGPEAITHRRPELERWLSQGHSGGLAYMERFFERQAEMLAGFPHTRSIIVLAAAYGPGPQPAAQDTGIPAGRVARYAQGRDYHRVLRKKVILLEGFIRARAGPKVRTLHCVDKGPLQERALAEAAGLGFIGKNTLLIRPGSGSFLFLSAVLTDLELAPDPPLTWDCGSCTLCLEACPTGALVAPYQLDAGLCIANLTIENRGPIPEKLRPQVGNWVFGCDICQEVCPYNRAKNPSRWEEFHPESGAGGDLPLASLLQIREESAYTARFTGTPLMRPGRPGLLRNAAVAAGNSGSPELVPDLLQALQSDPDPSVRSHSAWALGKIGTSATIHGLRETLSSEQDPAVLQEIRQAIPKEP